MPARKMPAVMVYVGDIKKDPQYAQLSAAAKGVWFEAWLSIAEQSQSGDGDPWIEGTVDQLARMCRVTPAEMTLGIIELALTGTADVKIEGETPAPGYIHSLWKTCGKLCGKPAEMLIALDECHADVALSHAVVTLINRRILREHRKRYKDRQRKQRQREREADDA